MSREQVARLQKLTKQFVRDCKGNLELQRRIFWGLHGEKIVNFFEFPVKLITAPITIPIAIAGSAKRWFGVPELISNLAFSAVFVVGTLGTYEITADVVKKVLCHRNCKTCNGWQALCCTMCKGAGQVQYGVKNLNIRSGEKATVECVAEAITENRAELVHIPSFVGTSFPLPYKECPNCDGTGVMGCPECKHFFPLRISADDIMESPWKAYNVLERNKCQNENIVDSMRDPKIAAFWLITMPQVIGGFDFDEELKRKVWWQYNESMKYSQIRNLVAKREPGWETLQNVLVYLDPARAREDPVIVKNVPYYKAKKALEAEVMKLDVPPRPYNWGFQELNLPLSETLWTKEELKDPKKLSEMTTLLNAQREMAEKILSAQWEATWRQQKLNELIEEKLQPCIQDLDTGVLPEPIIIQSPKKETKKRQRRWWFF